MRRRDFLLTLAIPFLPTPQLPITIVDIPFTSRPIVGFKLFMHGILVGNVKNWNVRTIGKTLKAHSMKEPVSFNVTIEET